MTNHGMFSIRFGFKSAHQFSRLIFLMQELFGHLDVTDKRHWNHLPKLHSWASQELLILFSLGKYATR